MLLGHWVVSTAMIDTYVLNQGSRGLKSPVDRLWSNLDPAFLGRKRRTILPPPHDPATCGQPIQPTLCSGVRSRLFSQQEKTNGRSQRLDQRKRPAPDPSLVLLRRQHSGLSGLWIGLVAGRRLVCRHEHSDRRN